MVIYLILECDGVILPPMYYFNDENDCSINTTKNDSSSILVARSVCQLGYRKEGSHLIIFLTYLMHQYQCMKSLFQSLSSNAGKSENIEEEFEDFYCKYLSNANLQLSKKELNGLTKYLKS